MCDMKLVVPLVSVILLVAASLACGNSDSTISATILATIEQGQTPRHPVDSQPTRTIESTDRPEPTSIPQPTEFAYGNSDSTISATILATIEQGQTPRQPTDSQPTRTIESTDRLEPTSVPQPTDVLQPTDTSVLTVSLCCILSGPLFFCVSIGLTMLYLRSRRNIKESKQALAEKSISFEHLLKKLKRDAKESEQALIERLTSFEHLVEKLERDALQVSRDEWLKSIRRVNYRNEIEVEVKFIHPLLQFLRYDSQDYQIRVPVTVQVGRKQTRGEADWVIWGATSGGKRQAIIVLEAKEPGQQLDTTVQDQARSYAFGLNAPIYVLTNGRQLKVFRRGVQNDTCVVDCDVNAMINSWTMIEQVIGANVCLGRFPNV
jgi:hypothetical protein